MSGILPNRLDVISCPKAVDLVWYNTLSEEELTAEIKKIIAEVGATSAKEMGKVMGVASKALAGKADGRAISTIVKSLLS